MIAPYFADESVTLYHGDMRDIVPTLEQDFAAIVADPPYGETSLGWDLWPEGWVSIAAAAARSMWCFGSMRMLLGRYGDFADWKFSQDIVWEKHNGSGFLADRFRRVHEHVTHWYQGPWDAAHCEVPTTSDATARQVRRKQRPAHMGDIERGSYESTDGGPRAMRSVIFARSMHGSAIHPTEKPVGLLDPLIRYVVPAGGVLLDPFAGSGSSAVAARLSGRRAVLIEINEQYCELAAQRLSQDMLPLDGAA